MEATEAYEELALQESSVIYEGNAQVIATSGSVFKAWYTSGWANRAISYAESLDGVNWVKHPSNPILAAVRSFVFKHGNTYFLYGIRNPGGYSKHSSADGITWNVDATQVLSGGVGEWDENGIANTTLWIEDGVWYVLYEGSNADGVYRIGLATSPDGVTWTKSPSNPVIDLSPGSGSSSHHVHFGNNHYLYSHIADLGVLPTDIAKFKSTDLVNWTRYPTGLSYPRTTRDEGVGVSAGQVADAHLVQAGDDTYLFYEGGNNGALPTFAMKVAKAIGYSLAQAAGSLDGIVTSYIPEELPNGGFERPGAGGADVFAWWMENASDGAIAKTTVAGEFRTGTGGAKLTAGAGLDTYLRQTFADGSFTVGAAYRLTGWAKGDGANKGRVRIFLSSGGSPFFDVVGGLSDFEQFAVDFTGPAEGVTLYVYCYCPQANGGIAYFDDLSLKRVA